MRLCIMVCVALAGCASMERQTSAINPGDTPEAVREVMGEPGDRQFSEHLEAWQYCKTGAGFGYHDFRIVWFRDGHVTGITSYKDHTPASGCSGHFRSIEWANAPS